MVEGMKRQSGVEKYLSLGSVAREGKDNTRLLESRDLVKRLYACDTDARHFLVTAFFRHLPMI